MEMTQLFVCENFYFEYKKVIAVEHPEFNLHVYPDLCANTQLKSETEEFFASLWVHGESYLLANNTCPILNFIPETNKAIITGKYCFSHLVCDDFIKYLLDEGGYLVSSSWLVNWEDNLAEMGFKQSTARIFFQEFAKKLVFLDSQIVENALELIHALGVYLDLPYTIIPVGTQQRGNLFSQIKTKVHFNKVENQYINSINELRMQCSEYAAIFDVHSKILSFTGIRDVIDKLSELFLMIFGAKKFKFWHWDSVQIPQEIKELDWAGENYILLSDEGSFYLKIYWEQEIYGVIDVGDFLFPCYLERYLNLALELAKVSGLVFYNARQYEKIRQSEQSFRYLSLHDALTGLYNRTYLNKILAKSENLEDARVAVFIFDIDKLKVINDTYGHAEGDRHIQAFAEILKKSFRDNDVVARIGGDEFIAVVTNSDVDLLAKIEERIKTLVNLHNETKLDPNLNLEVSLGYASQKYPEDTIEVLMKRADRRMYEQKVEKAGKS